MQRTLVAEFPPITIAVDRDGLDSVTFNPGYTDLTTGVYVFETQLDLSGYALERKSFYPYSSFEQRNGATFGSFATATQGRNLLDTIIVSSIPLDLTNAFAINYVTSLPGFTTLGLGSVFGSAYNEVSRLNRDPLIHQRQLVHSHDSTIAGSGGNSIYRLTSDVSASSLEPTAADKLYCYRFVKCDALDGSGFFPSARVLLPGTITSEPKLEYMMRLKRSYELANQV